MAIDSRNTRFILLGAIVAIALLALIIFANQPSKPEFSDDDFLPPEISIAPIAFSEINGWRNDPVEEAFPAFLRSCQNLVKRDPGGLANRNENLGEFLAGKTLSGTVSDWLGPCETALELNSPGAGDIRSFFESNFTPVSILARRAPKPDGPAKNEEPKNSPTGKFTGYFEPSYRASKTKTAAFDTPLYARPDNLIDVDLGAFRPDLAGERIAGQLQGKKLIPYPDRSEINEGAIGDAAEIIGWLNSNDLFFLQIQGSGRLEFENDALLRVGYAGQNGHKYTAIGRTMVQREIMPVKDVSMQSIRLWLDEASHADARELREQNASYVFFQTLDHLNANDGPLGAQGVPLTPLRSIAVDRRFHMLGAPVWISINAHEEDDAPIRKLMIAQDTGGAIRGPVRGDFFWGAGEDAAQMAGKMNTDGQMIVFLPNKIAAALIADQPSP